VRFFKSILKVATFLIHFHRVSIAFLSMPIYMGRLKSNEKMIVDYFILKRFYNNEFLRYGFWARRIKSILGHDLTTYEIRRIFGSLLQKNYFIKKELNKKSYAYQFTTKKEMNNPYNTNNVFVLTFD